MTVGHLRDPRGLALLALGAGCVQRGLAYALELGQPGGPKVNGVVLVLTANGQISMAVHAAGWVLVGLLALGAAILRRHRRLAGTLVAAMWLQWGLAYLLAHTMRLDPTAWVSSGTYGWTALALGAYVHLLDPVPEVADDD